jgi:hypothetical protein
MTDSSDFGTALGQQKKPQDWFSRCPAMAAFKRAPGRGKRGHIKWELSGSELRYLVAVGAFTNSGGFCKASQGKIATSLGIGRRLASRSEAALVKKGWLQSISIPRQRGRWGFRHLKMIYPEKDF